MHDMITGRMPAALVFLAFILSCQGKSESGGEAVIKFEGGTVTMDEIQARAGSHLAELRKREGEIQYRTALQILMEKIAAMEKGEAASPGKGDGENKRTAGGPGKGDLPAGTRGPVKDGAGKNGKRSPALPEGEEVQKLFIKYKVQNSLKRPE